MNKLIDSAMVAFTCITLLVNASCATTGEALRPTPEQMPEGRQICRALCSSYGRDYKEYRTDGKCVCQPLNDVTQM